MTLHLVSSNADPRPHPYDDWVFIDARHEAEWLQVEQEAQAWSVIWAVAFGAFVAGCIVTMVVEWVL